MIGETEINILTVEFLLSKLPINHCNQRMHLLNQYLCWTFQKNVLICHVSFILKVFNLYYYNGAVQYNSFVTVFFVDKNLFQLSEFLVTQATFVTN